MDKKHRNGLFAILILLSAGFIQPQSVEAHCQIPCGIYDDYARLQSMLEDVATIEKSVKMMIALAGEESVQSQNQMVRWVMNKEEHAQKTIDIISNYFLTQCVKPTQKDYTIRLKYNHAVILAAMKAKQSADLDSVRVLENSIKILAKYYPEHKHEKRSVG